MIERHTHLRMVHDLNRMKDSKRNINRISKIKGYSVVRTTRAVISKKDLDDQISMTVHDLMDDESSVENEVKSISREDIVRIVLVVCVAGIIGCLLYIFLFCDVFNLFSQNGITWNEDAIVEYGDTSYDPVKLAKNCTILEETPLDVYSVGEQTIRITYMMDGEEQTVKQTFTVEDTKKPKIEIGNDTITVRSGEKPDFDSAGISATDPVDGNASYYIESVKTDTIGTKKTKVVATDLNGNVSKKTLTIEVVGLGDEEDRLNFLTQRDELQKQYEEKKKREEEERKRRQEEKERQELIESLGVENLSDSVLQWALDVHKINQEIWDTQYDAIVLAVIQVESGGTACDLMQSSESKGGSAPGNSCGVYEDEIDSLRGGIQALKHAFELGGVRNADDYDHIAYALQGYNFGSGWFSAYDKYTRSNAEAYSETMKKELNTSVYGNPHYPELVFRYYRQGITIPDEEEPEVPVEPEKPEVPEEPEDSNPSEGNEDDSEDDKTEISNPNKEVLR